MKNHYELFENHPAYVAVVAQISEENPAGLPANDSEEYELIIDELRKLGGLHQETIQWAKVQQKAIDLLREKSKDVQCFTGLVLSLLRSPPVSIPLVLILIVDFFTRWHESGYPSVKVARNKRLWSNRVGQLANYFIPLLEEATFTSLDEPVVECRNRLKQLCSEVEWLAESGLSGITRAIRIMEHAPKASQIVEESISTKRTTPSTPPERSTEEIQATQKHEMSSREVRTLCERLINHQAVASPYNPLIFRLRRYMLWQGIDALPPVDQEQRLPLPAPPVDLRHEYHEQLHRGVDTELWTRLETSLEKSPYWLTGHRLSHEYALQLGYNDLASVIEEEAVAFFQTFPELVKLSFSDPGTKIPCADEETVKWLESHVPVVTKEAETQSVVAEEGTGSTCDEAVHWIIDSPLPTDLVTEALCVLKQEGLEQALQLFAQYLAQDIEPRSRCYAGLALAELYEKTGLEALAAEQYELLAMQVENNIKLEEWEPKLLNHIQTKLLIYQKRKPDQQLVIV